MARTIVSVWLDDTSDDHGWIVDTDALRVGGESNTLKVFPPTGGGFDRAVRFGKRAAARRECDLHICNGVSRIVLSASVSISEAV
jgi:hypothetical protein